MPAQLDSAAQYHASERPQTRRPALLHIAIQVLSIHHLAPAEDVRLDLERLQVESAAVQDDGSVLNNLLRPALDDFGRDSTVTEPQVCEGDSELSGRHLLLNPVRVRVRRVDVEDNFAFRVHDSDVAHAMSPARLVRPKLLELDIECDRLALDQKLE